MLMVLLGRIFLEAPKCVELLSSWEFLNAPSMTHANTLMRFTSVSVIMFPESLSSVISLLPLVCSYKDAWRP